MYTAVSLTKSIALKNECIDEVTRTSTCFSLHWHWATSQDRYQREMYLKATHKAWVVLVWMFMTLNVQSGYSQTCENKGPTTEFCEVLIDQYHHLCYDDILSQDCCQSCDELRQQPECPFGNKRPSFCNSLTVNNCTSSGTIDDCCELCEDITTQQLEA
ncbi:hypothetical protein EB796_021505 [Bugula neritina]|uniref:Uncharacterized protein n=1 Tax=Bugula neritina TaxID=10212 RepID=A0A7J7J301_BUGNE|nr:hypothetical protein EB796_021505 [Bugula neritina]